MRYRVRHQTSYHYSEAVNLCRNEACLLPRDTANQRCLSSAIEVSPEPVDLNERLDFFGNRRNHFAIQQSHEKLTVTVVSDVEVSPPLLLPEPGQSLPWEDVVGLFVEGPLTDELLDACSCLYPSTLVPLFPALNDYARISLTPGRPLLEGVDDLMRRIYREFTYDPASTTIATPLVEVSEKRRGVCQDFAHFAIGCLRTMGLPARYVSGYIETLPPPGQPRLVGADASHAWFGVFLPGCGWVDFDPTNNQRPSQQHITVAWGRDFSDVSPLKGIALGGGDHRVVVSVDVARQVQPMLQLIVEQQQQQQ